MITVMRCWQCGILTDDPKSERACQNCNEPTEQPEAVLVEYEPPSALSVREDLLQSQGYRCVYCFADLRSVQAHKDHLQPRKLGGLDISENFVMACGPCNLSKSAKHPAVWLRENAAAFAEKERS